jgi:YfiH family protein
VVDFIFSKLFPHSHFTTLRSAGNMKNKTERASFFQSCSLDSKDLVLANQVHGNNVKVVKSSDKNTIIDNCDALITNDNSVLLGIFTADCIPILISCGSGKTKAAVHAGWKGLYFGIVENTIEILRKDFCINSKDIKVYIGPHIRFCCYKTGYEMEDKFNVKLVDSKLDLSAILFNKLKTCDINEIFDVNQCTYHNEDLFFSYRRNSCTQRLLSVI